MLFSLLLVGTATAAPTFVRDLRSLTLTSLVPTSQCVEEGGLCDKAAWTRPLTCYGGYDCVGDEFEKKCTKQSALTSVVGKQCGGLSEDPAKDYVNCGSKGAYCQYFSSTYSQCVATKTCEPETNWNTCATENGSVDNPSQCECAGMVRYGNRMLEDKYVTVPAEHQTALSANGFVDCSNDVFGDPLPGRPKQCECCEGAGCPSLDSPCEGSDWRCKGADQGTCLSLQASGVECSWGGGDTAAVCPTRTCSGWGDPHYTAFSGRRFDFQGECEYRLVSSVCSAPAATETAPCPPRRNVDGERSRCGPLFGKTSCPREQFPYCNEFNGYCGQTEMYRDAQEATTYDYCDTAAAESSNPFAVAGPAVAATADTDGSFEVQVRNVGWGTRGTVSITGAMALRIPGVQGVLEFYERHNGGIRFNGTKLHVSAGGVHLPSTRGDQIVVKPNGMTWMDVNGTFMAAVYKSGHNFKVLVGCEFEDKLCGLCGAVSSALDSPLIKKKVAEADSFFSRNRERGASCGTGSENDDGGAEDDDATINDDPVPECVGVKGEIADGFCSVIKDVNGPYAVCHPVVDPEQYFNDCKFDVCATGKDIACDMVLAYEDACKEAAADVAGGLGSVIDVCGVCFGDGTTCASDDDDDGGGELNDEGDPGGSDDDNYADYGYGVLNDGGDPGGSDDAAADDDVDDDFPCLDACGKEVTKLWEAFEGAGGGGSTTKWVQKWNLISITLEYTGYNNNGGNVVGSTYTPPAAQLELVGQPGPEGASQVTVSLDGTKTALESAASIVGLEQGDEFTLEVAQGERWDDRLVLTVRSNAGVTLTTVVIDTSCGAPLVVGDLLGPFKIKTHRNTGGCYSGDYTTTTTTTTLTSTSTSTSTSTTTTTSTSTVTTTSTSTSTTTTTSTSSTTSTSTSTTSTTSTSTTTTTSTSTSTSTSTITTTSTSTTTSTTTSTSTSTTTTTSTSTVTTRRTFPPITLKPCVGDCGGELNDEGDPGGGSDDDDNAGGLLTDGNDAGGVEPPVLVLLVADSLDYDVVLPTPAHEAELSTVFGNVLQASGIAVLQPTTFSAGSIIVSIMVDGKDTDKLYDLFSGCQFCFQWESYQICPRPSQNPSCSKSGFTSIEQALQEQQAVEAAAAAKAAKTTSAVVPVIAIVLVLAVVGTLVLAKRRVKEAKDREDEQELSMLKKGGGTGTGTSTSTDDTFVDTTNTLISVASVRKQETRDMLNSTLAGSVAAPPPSPELEPATLSLSSDGASIRLVSTRRGNPLYAAAAGGAGAGAGDPQPTYDQGVASEAIYDEAEPMAVAPYAYSEGVPLYEAAASGVGEQATYAIASSDTDAAIEQVTYAVATDGNGGAAGTSLYDAPADAVAAAAPTGGEANYDIAAAAAAVPAGGDANYDIGAAAVTASYDVADAAAQQSSMLIPTGPLLYAVADAEGGALSAAGAEGGESPSRGNSRRASVAGDDDGLGMHHMPGQPLRRSNSYGNALNDAPDSPPAPSSVNLENFRVDNL